MQRVYFVVLCLTLLITWGIAFYFFPFMNLGDEQADAAEIRAGAPFYLLQVMGVGSLLVCVPLALKWMAFGFVRKSIVRNEQGVYAAYAWQCLGRLTFLGVALMLNFATYLFLPQSTPLLCAAIGVIGLVFCYPSYDRMDYELRFIEEEVDEEGHIKK